MATTTEKMTYAKAIDYVLNTYDLPTEVNEKFVALAASFAKKASADRKPTAQQTANAEYQQTIVEYLRSLNGEGRTCNDLIHEVPALAGFSNQRVSMLLSPMVKDGRVTKYVEKRRSYFCVTE